MSAHRILIVEDEPDGADLLYRLLKARGQETVLVGHAEGAIAWLETDPTGFDAVIIDLALPDMDGFELMYRLRASAAFADLPLIAITAFHTPELKVQALENGFSAYFPKPLDAAALVSTLERIVP
jgi:DNA-binding response OmpR family regulator